MLNKFEKPIISCFMKNLDIYENEVMTLIWRDGSKVEALFDTCFEDESDCDINEDQYEEFVSFAFTVVSITGQPPVIITEDTGFLVNYHNFPDEIFAGGRKIN